MCKNIVKALLIMVLVVVFTFIGVFCVENYSIKMYDKAFDQYRPIYEIIKEEDGYSTAKIKDGSIIFYDKSRNEIKNIALESGFKGKLLYIEKRDDSVIFWRSGSIDDLSGIMFLEGEWTSSDWNGIVRATRLQGNAYEVHTFR